MRVEKSNFGYKLITSNQYIDSQHESPESKLDHEVDEMEGLLKRLRNMLVSLFPIDYCLIELVDQEKAADYIAENKKVLSHSADSIIVLSLDYKGNTVGLLRYTLYAELTELQYSKLKMIADFCGYLIYNFTNKFNSETGLDETLEIEVENQQSSDPNCPNLHQDKISVIKQFAGDIAGELQESLDNITDISDSALDNLVTVNVENTLNNIIAICDEADQYLTNLQKFGDQELLEYIPTKISDPINWALDKLASRFAKKETILHKDFAGELEIPLDYDLMNQAILNIFEFVLSEIDYRYIIDIKTGKEPTSAIITINALAPTESNPEATDQPENPTDDKNESAPINDLPLVLASIIIRAHGGDLSLTNQDHNIPIFNITLPLEQSKNE